MRAKRHGIDSVAIDRLGPFWLFWYRLQE